MTNELKRVEEPEIKLIARGLTEGRIFTLADCPPDMIASVFMPVGLGCLSEYDFDEIGMVFEWMYKASPRGINGFPIFLSCNVVHRDDWDRVIDRATKITAALEEAMK